MRVLHDFWEFLLGVSWPGLGDLEDGWEPQGTLEQFEGGPPDLGHLESRIGCREAHKRAGYLGCFEA